MLYQLSKHTRKYTQLQKKIFCNHRNFLLKILATPSRQRQVSLTYLYTLNISLCAQWHLSFGRLNEAGKNVHVSDYSLSTPLHLAVAGGHLECVQYLVETCNASITAKNK